MKFKIAGIKNHFSTRVSTNFIEFTSAEDFSSSYPLNNSINDLKAKTSIQKLIANANLSGNASVAELEATTSWDITVTTFK